MIMINAALIIIFTSNIWPEKIPRNAHGARNQCERLAYDPKARVKRLAFVPVYDLFRSKTNGHSNRRATVSGLLIAPVYARVTHCAWRGCNRSRSPANASRAFLHACLAPGPVIWQARSDRSAIISRFSFPVEW